METVPQNANSNQTADIYGCDDERKKSTSTANEVTYQNHYIHQPNEISAFILTNPPNIFLLRKKIDFPFVRAPSTINICWINVSQCVTNDCDVPKTTLINRCEQQNRSRRRRHRNRIYALVRIISVCNNRQDWQIKFVYHCCWFSRWHNLCTIYYFCLISWRMEYWRIDKIQRAWIRQFLQRLLSFHSCGSSNSCHAK